MKYRFTSLIFICRGHGSVEPSKNLVLHALAEYGEDSSACTPWLDSAQTNNASPTVGFERIKNFSFTTVSTLAFYY